MSGPRGLLAKIDATGLPLLAARLIVGATMVYFSIAKLSAPAAFLKEIHTYAILPAHPPYLLNLTAVMMPWAELLLGVVLLLGVLVRGAAGLVVLMLVVFTSAILHRAIGVQQAAGIAFCAVEFDCGCGTGVVNICEKLAFNLGLIAFGVVALVSDSRRFCLSAWIRRG